MRAVEGAHRGRIGAAHRGERGSLRHSRRRRARRFRRRHGPRARRHQRHRAVRGCGPSRGRGCGGAAWARNVCRRAHDRGRRRSFQRGTRGGVHGKPAGDSGDRRPGRACRTSPTKRSSTLREQPRRLLVLGAGAVGLELAQAFARLGTEVVRHRRRGRISSTRGPGDCDRDARHPRVRGHSDHPWRDAAACRTHSRAASR